MMNSLSPSKFLSGFLPRAVRMALYLMLLFFVSPIFSLGGWFWILSRFWKLLRRVIALRRLARDELFCPSGHHVTIFGKWRCPSCHGIWQGPAHRCTCCRLPMDYLVCQNPGCGLATKLPDFS